MRALPAVGDASRSTLTRRTHYHCAVFTVVEINESNWQVAVAVEGRSDQVTFVASHQPVALVILSKCYVCPDGLVWRPYLALDGDVPVGVAAIASGPGRAQLRHVAIDHRRQGEGLGRRFVDALVATISRTQPSCRSVVVTTHPDNQVALSLYLTAGFHRTGVMSGIEPLLELDIPNRSPADTGR
jgi:ribosomal protein S18 acetylase RimI-like enzyme